MKQRIGDKRRCSVREVVKCSRGPQGSGRKLDWTRKYKPDDYFQITGKLACPKHLRPVQDRIVCVKQEHLRDGIEARGARGAHDDAGIREVAPLSGISWGIDG